MSRAGERELTVLGKRVFDLCAATLALALLAPLLALLAFLVRLNLGAPVLFRQRRPGRHGHPFTLVKFRSMTESRDAHGRLLADADRLTAFGVFLRRSSLDELPELFNVVRGDMSLVGPRPLLMRYTEFFTERERRRLDVPPGITGWAQIHGRNEAGWNERLARDVWYVEHRSLRLDLAILWRTTALVLRRDGAVADARSIMRNLDEERGERESRP